MTFRELLSQDRPVLGLYVSSPDANLIEIAAAAGVDYIRLDLEHGMIGSSEARELIRASTLSGMPVQARVADLSGVTRLLDFGVTAIIVPGIDSVSRVREAVEQVKYAPLGMRGFNDGPRFLRFCSTGFSDYVRTANEEVLLGVQIESREAVERLDEILQVEGLDLVSSGKGDLSQSYGLMGQNTHPLILEKEAFILAKAQEYGKTATALSTGEARTRELYARGVKMITIGSDMGVYSYGISEFLRKHRGEK